MDITISTTFFFTIVLAKIKKCLVCFLPKLYSPVTKDILFSINYIL